MLQLKPVKRGDTFIFSVNLMDADDKPLLIDTQNIKSQVRTPGGSLVADLTIQNGENDGEYILSHSDNSLWPIGWNHCDIQLTVDGYINSSETFAVIIVEDVTRNE